MPPTIWEIRAWRATPNCRRKTLRQFDSKQGYHWDLLGKVEMWYWSYRRVGSGRKKVTGKDGKINIDSALSGFN